MFEIGGTHLITINLSPDQKLVIEIFEMRDTTHFGCVLGVNQVPEDDFPIEKRSFPFPELFHVPFLGTGEQKKLTRVAPGRPRSPAQPWSPCGHFFKSPLTSLTSQAPTKNIIRWNPFSGEPYPYHPMIQLIQCLCCSKTGWHISDPLPCKSPCSAAARMSQLSLARSNLGGKQSRKALDRCDRCDGCDRKTDIIVL